MGLLSTFITVTYYLFIFVGWLIPFYVGNYYITKGKESKAKWSNNFGAIWLIGAIIYAIYVYITFLIGNSWILSPTLVVFIMIISLITLRFIFPSQHITFELKELSRYRNLAFGLIFILPILIGFTLYTLKLNIDVETARVLYSSLFLAFTSLLVLVVMFSIFIIERHVHHRIVNILIQTVKGVSILYGIAILMSLVAMVSLPSSEISFNSISNLNSSIFSSIFFGTLSIAINSIILTIIIFFQIVDVLKEENPPSVDHDNVVFDETRLYSTGFKSEASISNQNNEGYSNFYDALEDNKFSVSKITVKPITYETLSKYDVLVIPRINGDYSTNEINAIEKFVQKGGGLLLTSGFLDHPSKKIIAEKFGIGFEYGQLNQEENNFENNTIFPQISHLENDEIFNNIESFYFVNSLYISEKGNSHILAYADDDAWFIMPNKKPDDSGNFPIISKMEYGNGRIIFMTSYFQFSNYWIDKLNNKMLGLNVVKWLVHKR
ncbi:MAG: DUF4350 domain-containing protein [Methanobacterium sp.]